MNGAPTHAFLPPPERAMVLAEHAESCTRSAITSDSEDRYTYMCQWKWPCHRFRMEWLVCLGLNCSIRAVICQAASKLVDLLVSNRLCKHTMATVGFLPCATSLACAFSLATAMR